MKKKIIILAAFVITLFTACTSTHMITFSNAELSLSLIHIFSEKMVQIEFFQSKFYNSLKSVEAIIKTGKDVYKRQIMYNKQEKQQHLLEH